MPRSLLATALILLACDAYAPEPPPKASPHTVAAIEGVVAHSVDHTAICKHRGSGRREGLCQIDSLHVTPDSMSLGVHWQHPTAPLVDSTMHLLYQYRFTAGADTVHSDRWHLVHEKSNRLFGHQDTMVVLWRANMSDGHLIRIGDTVDFRVRAGYKHRDHRNVHGRNEGPWARTRFVYRPRKDTTEPTFRPPPPPPGPVTPPDTTTTKPDTTKTDTTTTVPDTTTVTPPGGGTTGPTCAELSARFRSGKRSTYSGECHDPHWTYFTIDARSKGGESITILPQPDGTLAVCGHSNEEPIAVDRGGKEPVYLWCPSEYGQWVWIDAPYRTKGSD